MLELSLEQMKRLAEIVTGKPHYIHRYNGKTYITDMEYLCSDNYYIHNYWNPQMDGGVPESAQAFKVLIAALNLPQTAELSKRGGGSWQFINQDPEYSNVKIGGAFADNLLHASALALLGDKA